MQPGPQMCSYMTDCSPLKFIFPDRLLAYERKWPNMNERRNIFYIIAAQKRRTMSLTTIFKADIWQSWLGILPIIFANLLTVYMLLHQSEQHLTGSNKREHCRTAKHHYYCSNFTGNPTYLWSMTLQKSTCKTQKHHWKANLRDTFRFF